MPYYFSYLARNISSTYLVWYNLIDLVKEYSVKFEGRVILTLKIGIIGTGYFSKFHAAILSEMAGVKIAAICGTSSEKASAMASNFTDAKGYYNLVDMLDAEHLDAVYICVPPMGHGEIELALIKRGIPFLVEKPLGNELEIPTTVLEGIKEKSLLTSVGYHYRYSESVSSLKREVAGQNIGIALGQWMVKCRRFRGGGNNLILADSF